MRRLALYPRLIEGAALAHEPHRIAFYLYELASEFHAQWTRGKDLPHLRFIIQNDPEITAARLALVQGIVTVSPPGLQCSESKRRRKCDRAGLVCVLPFVVRTGRSSAPTGTDGGRQLSATVWRRSLRPWRATARVEQ